MTKYIHLTQDERYQIHGLRARGFSGKDIAEELKRTGKASAETIAVYLAVFAGKSVVATLLHRLIAIHRAHTDHNIPYPIMDRCIQMNALLFHTTVKFGNRSRLKSISLV